MRLLTEHFRLNPFFAKPPAFVCTTLMKEKENPLFAPTVSQHGAIFIENLSLLFPNPTAWIVPDHMGFGKSETPQDREYHTKHNKDYWV